MDEQTINGIELSNIYIRTPLIESITLRKYCDDHQIYLKLENCQPCGNYKLRGISELCKDAKMKGYRKVICSSSGNAALATAYSAMKLKMQCEIVVTRNTSKEVCDSLEELGANITICGNVWHEANEKALSILNSSDDIFYVHPFDHPILWQGHSTIIDEIAEEIGPNPPSLVVSCCGGGGLINGLVQGIRRNNWQNYTKIVAMETLCTSSLNAAIKAGGKAVELQNMNTIVTCLSANRVCDQVIQYYHEDDPPILSRVVEDKDSVDSCIKFANDHRFLVGLACGTALSAIYKGFVSNILTDNEEECDVIFDKKKHTNYWLKDGPIVVIVCGGSDITFGSLQKFKEMFHLKD